MRPLILAVAAVLVILTSQLAGAEVNMKDGLWEITTSIEMPGMPMAMQPITVTQCLTKDNMVPEPQEQGAACKVADMKQSGNTISWNVKCVSDGETMTSKGHITYSGTTFSGTIVSEAPTGMGAGPTTFTTKMQGRFLGPCQKK